MVIIRKVSRNVSSKNRTTIGDCTHHSSPMAETSKSKSQVQKYFRASYFSERAQTKERKRERKRDE